MKTIEVVAAIIKKDKKIFVAERGYGDWKGYYEMPGGKIEKGETKEAALIREVKEELDTDIKVETYIDSINYDYPNFHLTMHCFLCSIVKGKLTLLEHENAKWLSANEMENVKWLPADIQILEKLKEIAER